MHSLKKIKFSRYNKKLNSLKNEKNDKIKKLVIANYFLLTFYHIISII